MMPHSLSLLVPAGASPLAVAAVTEYARLQRGEAITANASAGTTPNTPWQSLGRFRLNGLG